MDDNDIDSDKASQRANLIEQRMHEITIASIETMKHTAAIELHKAQNEMKKRLRKYRDRQREIIRSKTGFDKDPIEQLMARQLQTQNKGKKKVRPKTTQALTHAGNSRSTSERTSRHTSLQTSRRSSPRSSRRSARTNGISSPRKTNSSPDCDSVSDDSDSDVEVDGTFMIDQQKSKIDLRPKTALDIARRGIPWESYVHNGRLGSQTRQIRYFDDDELKERDKIYKYLVSQKIDTEKHKLETLDEKVAKFCETETVQTMMKKMLLQRKPFTTYSDWGATNKHNVTEVVTINPGNNVDIQNAKSNVRPNTSTGSRTMSANRSHISSTKLVY